MFRLLLVVLTFLAMAGDGRAACGFSGTNNQEGTMRHDGSAFYRCDSGNSWASVGGVGGDDLGDHTATQNLAMGTNQVSFNSTGGDKAWWFSNTYGTGTETNTLTNWSASQFRWRIGGTSVSSGVAYMSLTTAGLEVSGTVKATGYQIGSSGSNMTLDAWDSTDTDIDGLVPGSTAGMRLQGYTNGHIVVGIRDNDANDGLYVVSTNGSYGTDNAYDTMVMAMKGDGRVGIGTTAPSVALTVSGSVYASVAYLASTADSVTAPGYAWSGDTNTGLHHPSPDTIGFTTSGTEAMRINSSNQVGIGTAVPSTTLHAYGPILSAVATGGAFTVGQDNLQLRMDGNEIQANTAGAVSLLYLNKLGGGVNIGSTGNTGNLVVYGTGTTCTIGNGTTATNCTSDARLKTDVRLIEGALEKVARLRGVSFAWKNPAKHGRFVGVIAQDVEAVFPEAVGTVSDTVLGTAKTVDYGALVGPLIEAVKELKADNDNLRAEVGPLQQELRAMQKNLRAK